MALVRKEAGKRQDEVSRGVLPPLDDGSRIMLPPKKLGGRAGWAGDRVRKSNLSPFPPPLK